MRKRRVEEAYQALRRRMIQETELALHYGLRFPKRIPRIPAREVGNSTFAPSLAMKFWAEALDIDIAEIEGVKCS